MRGIHSFPLLRPSDLISNAPPVPTSCFTGPGTPERWRSSAFFTLHQRMDMGADGRALLSPQHHLKSDDKHDQALENGRSARRNWGAAGRGRAEPLPDGAST